ncbi:cyclase family protein [candidate division KSB1 bacterium]|nr:cyclase family protein [candidate division KSB1 bacterium]
MNTSVLDLSHQLHPEMLLYPGTQPVQIKKVSTLAVNGFNETQFTFTSHVGTHLDAPAHLIPDGKSLDQFAPETFWGQAAFLDCRSCKSFIDKDLIQKNKSLINNCPIIILATHYCHKWPDSSYFSDYPVLTDEAAQFLVSQNIKILGMDTISVDPMDSTNLPIHHILLGNECLIIENILIPDELIGKCAEMVLSPIKYSGADGSPVRIWAKI